MRVSDFIDTLNLYKPTKDEIIYKLFSSKSLEIDNDVLDEFIEDYNYKIIIANQSTNLIENIIECTNVYGKGIGEIHFAEKIEHEDGFILFASTERGLELLIDVNTGIVYAKNTYEEDEPKRIAGDVNDF